MTLAIDGTAHNTGIGTLAVSLTTTQINDYIIVCFTSNGSPSVSVVGSTLGAFTQIGLATRDVGTHTQEIWAKFSSSPISSETITVTLTVSDFITIDAFGISGAGQTSLVFDSGGPQVLNGAVADPISITTVNINTMVIATFGLSAAPTNTAGNGFTLVSAIDWSVVEYKILSAPATTVAALGIPSSSNGSIVIAIAASGISLIRPVGQAWM